MDVVQLKITYGDTLRKVPCPRTLPPSPYDSLLVLIKQRFNLANSAQVELLVKDEDGDWVTIVRTTSTPSSKRKRADFAPHLFARRARSSPDLANPQSSDLELHELFDSLKYGENSLRLQLRTVDSPVEEEKKDDHRTATSTPSSQSLNSSSDSVDDWLELSEGDVNNGSEIKSKEEEPSTEVVGEEDPADPVLPSSPSLADRASLLREAEFPSTPGTSSTPLYSDDPALPSLDPEEAEASTSAALPPFATSIGTLFSSFPLRAESLSTHLSSLLSPASSSALSRLSSLAAAPTSLLPSSPADLTSLAQTLSALSTDVGLAAAEIADGVRKEAEQARRDFEKFKQEAEKEAKEEYERVLREAGSVKKGVEQEMGKVGQSVEEVRAKALEEIKARATEMQQTAEKAVEQAQATAAAVASSFVSSSPSPFAPAPATEEGEADPVNASPIPADVMDLTSSLSLPADESFSSVSPDRKEEITTLLGEMRDETQEYLERIQKELLGGVRGAHYSAVMDGEEGERKKEEKREEKEEKGVAIPGGLDDDLSDDDMPELSAMPAVAGSFQRNVQDSAMSALKQQLQSAKVNVVDGNGNTWSDKQLRLNEEEREKSVFSAVPDLVRDDRMCNKPQQPLSTETPNEQKTEGDDPSMPALISSADDRRTPLEKALDVAVDREMKLREKAAKAARKAAREEKRREKEVKRAEKEERRRVRAVRREAKAQGKGKAKAKEQAQEEVEKEKPATVVVEDDSSPSMPGALPTVTPAPTASTSASTSSPLPSDPSGPVLLTSFLLYLRDQLGFAHAIDSPQVKKKLTEIWCEANGRGVEAMVERAIVEVLEV